MVVFESRLRPPFAALTGKPACRHAAQKGKAPRRQKQKLRHATRTIAHAARCRHQHQAAKSRAGWCLPVRPSNTILVGQRATTEGVTPGCPAHGEVAGYSMRERRTAPRCQRRPPPAADRPGTPEIQSRATPRPPAFKRPPMACRPAPRPAASMRLRRRSQRRGICV